jgi:hypothetical protein
LAVVTAAEVEMEGECPCGKWPRQALLVLVRAADLRLRWHRAQRRSFLWESGSCGACATRIPLHTLTHTHTHARARTHARTHTRNSLVTCLGQRCALTSLGHTEAIVSLSFFDKNVRAMHRYIMAPALPPEAQLRVRAEPSMDGAVVGTVTQADGIMASPDVTSGDYLRVQVDGWPTEVCLPCRVLAFALLLFQKATRGVLSSHSKSFLQCCSCWWWW